MIAVRTILRLCNLCGTVVEVPEDFISEEFYCKDCFNDLKSDKLDLLYVFKMLYGKKELISE